VEAEPKPDVYLELKCCCGAQLFIEARNKGTFESYLRQVAVDFIAAHKHTCAGPAAVKEPR